MALPAKKYFSLRDLAEGWGVAQEDVEYSVVHDGLATCCWLDRREAVVFHPSSDGLPRSGHYEYELVEGYVGVQAADCRKIFRVGKYRITEFLLLNRPGMMIGLMGRNADAVISTNCLRVTAEERERFEGLFSLHTKPAEHNGQRESGLIVSMDVQDCIFNGEAHEADDSLDCLRHLLCHVAEGQMLGSHMALVGAACKKGEGALAGSSLKVLTNYGIRVDETDFYVSNNSPNVEKAYSGTKYGLGAWKKALKKVEGAETPPHPVAFASLGKTRCVKLPLSLIEAEEIPDGIPLF